MDKKYKEVLSEVNYIINALEEDEKNKIPLNFKNFISDNSSKHHIINIDLLKGVEEQNLHQETISILSIIYRKFLASSEEREILEKQYNEKLQQEIQLINKTKEEREIHYFSVNNTNREAKLFEIVDREEALEEVKEIIKYQKEKWYERILNKIKYVFSKK